jgi:hypothetical protein
MDQLTGLLFIHLDSTGHVLSFFQEVIFGTSVDVCRRCCVIEELPLCGLWERFDLPH